MKSYVAAELADATHAPWSSSPMSVTSGPTRRELYPLSRVTYFTPAFGRTQPSVHTIYGLWLYGWKTGDWATHPGQLVHNQVDVQHPRGEGDIYGTMAPTWRWPGMADKFGDTTTRTTALRNLQTQLNAGVTFSTIESRVSSKSWPEMYTSRGGPAACIRAGCS